LDEGVKAETRMQRPETASVQTVVVGGGVIGLAIARALAMGGREVIVLERNAGIGEETSSRNSEVIHAGIYYPADSLKARLCVAGKRQLYTYCRDKSIPHRACGKVVLAVERAQEPGLRSLLRRAGANGVVDTEWLSGSDLRALEPALKGSAALWSPSTGILDSHAFMLALQADLEAAGGVVACRSELREGSIVNEGVRLLVSSNGDSSSVLARELVNAAGLHASTVARSLRGLRPDLIPETRYAKGNYYYLKGPSPFGHLVYPLPEPGGLGIHATLDLGDRARFGPDVEWIDSPDYSVDAGRAQAFYAAVRRYWPDLRDDALVPGYAGVRPKVVGPGEPAGDFLIQGSDHHGVPGLVNLFGIESPGLTAALAIGEHVAELLSLG
jgi:L-2-hydroxyglutarate oxidase LhgO